MKKLLLSILILSSILLSCSNDKVAPPVIVLQSAVIEPDSTINYKDSIEKMPVLNAGDEVELGLFLDGNGSALNTLNISTSNNNIEIQLIPSEEGLISGNTNFTDLEKGRVGFIDDVPGFYMKAKIRVISIQEVGKVKLTFHLSARAECEGGGVLELEFKTANNSASKSFVVKQ